MHFNNWRAGLLVVLQILKIKYFSLVYFFDVSSNQILVRFRLKLISQTRTFDPMLSNAAMVYTVEPTPILEYCFSQCPIQIADL